MILLLLPGAALAQSAGDNQYSDPFAGKSPSSGSSPSSSPSPQAPSSSQSGGSGSQASSNPSTSSSGSAGNSSASSSTSGSLPRTGLRAWLLVAIGALMLLAGALLRFFLRPLSARGAKHSPPVLGRDVRLPRSRR